MSYRMKITLPDVVAAGWPPLRAPEASASPPCPPIAQKRSGAIHDGRAHGTPCEHRATRPRRDAQRGLVNAQDGPAGFASLRLP
jgi:hypothetical protein